MFYLFCGNYYINENWLYEVVFVFYLREIVMKFDEVNLFRVNFVEWIYWILGLFNFWVYVIYINYFFRLYFLFSLFILIII